jgi:RND family efflux transporter MFP subunit
LSAAAETIRPGRAEERAQPREAARSPAAGDANSWDSFAAAASDESFYGAWLALQCAAVPGTLSGLLLLRGAEQRSFAPVALWPDPQRNLKHLSNAAQRALSESRGLVVGLSEDDAPDVVPGTVHVAFPLEMEAEIVAAVVLEVRSRPAAELQQVLRQLLWGAGWLKAQLARRELIAKAGVLERASIALELLQAVQEPESLSESAMALVNELSTMARAERVSLGIERKGHLRLCAMSRTAWFDPKSQLVEVMERAMEEAIDQEAAVAHPPVPGSRGLVTMAQRELAGQTGATSVLTVPILDGGRPIGALTLERDHGPDFEPDAVALCEAICALVGATLRTRVEGERWFSGRFARLAGDWRDRLIGPGHQSLKAAVAVAGLVVVFLAFARGEFRVAARTSLEGSVQRAAVAPYDGFIRNARVRAGATVRKGELLAEMDDRDLRLDQARWEAEREQVARRYAEALAKRERAATGIIAAQVAQAESQLALAEEKLARTRITAPFDGLVVSGDLSQSLGAPVEKGKVLFELAPLDAYRVVLRIDERDIGFVRPGQRGELALSGIADQTLPFVVRTVTAVSTPQDGRNFFRVEAQLDRATPRLRPGMEGIGKVAIEQRSLVWIWTRNFVDWLRLSFWNWTP